ncbi:MAG TPA: phosphoenolpyruvate kinase [Candidatus Eisenbacteria bacterium]|jgi:citrate lyase beta subunit
MQTLINDNGTREILARLARANSEFALSHPGDPTGRQPVHTVYGGAHLFNAGLAGKLGATALRVLEEHAPDPASFASALGLCGAELTDAVYTRVIGKLRREPVEDFRIDFEDGYGYRTDAEEDAHAVAVGEQLAAGMEQGTLPPFIGIRIKPFTEELWARAVSTLDLTIGTLAERVQGQLPSGFVVTLPKVTTAAQVGALVDLFEVLERRTSLAAGSLQVELMIETPQAILEPGGRVAPPRLVAAARGRCRSVHFGTYDYTALLGITAPHQSHTHPACDFARHIMQVSLAQTGVILSDGATTVMPIAPHRAGKAGPPLSPAQLEENRRAVHAAWKLHYDNVRSSLRHGIYQGWDLNPAQLPIRYAAVFAFFLEGRAEAARRLRGFIEKAAQATLSGNLFDDAATGQGLLNYFLRGINCGALTEQEALDAGLTLEELRGRSFMKIVEARRPKEP